MRAREQGEIVGMLGVVSGVLMLVLAADFWLFGVLGTVSLIVGGVLVVLAAIAR